MVSESKKAIKQMKKLYKDYEKAEEKDHQTFRNLVYFYSIFLNFVKHETEMELEKDIAEIKEKLGI